MGSSRRQFLATLSLSVLAEPLSALAQSGSKIPRIGFLSQDVAEAGIGRQQKEFLLEGLSHVGYRVGENIAIEWRFAEGIAERLPQLANELVRLNVSVIVTPASYSPAFAAVRATRSIPIVMGAFPGDPVAAGLVSSYARPGGNITGTVTTMPVVKRFQILKEASSAAAKVAYVFAEGRYPAATMERIAKLGIALTEFPVKRPDEIPETLKRIAVLDPDALYVSTDAVVRSRLAEIAAFAIKRKLMTMNAGLIGVREGLLLYYGANIPAAWRRTAALIDRILKGAKPADLPIEQPTQYELVMNGKTARAIGYRVPPSLANRIDRVIE